jgi:hypothetical protein
MVLIVMPKFWIKLRVVLKDGKKLNPLSISLSSPFISFYDDSVFTEIGKVCCMCVYLFIHIYISKKSFKKLNLPPFTFKYDFFFFWSSTSEKTSKNIFSNKTWNFNHFTFEEIYKGNKVSKEDSFYSLNLKNGAYFMLLHKSFISFFYLINKIIKINEKEKEKE